MKANNNEQTSTGMWTLECGEAFEIFENKNMVFQYLLEITTKLQGGRIDVDEDVGEHSWFSTLILRMNPRIIQMHFAIEWYNTSASLIFFDDAGGEYRSKDIEHPIELDEETRKKIAHGEFNAHPLDECLSFQRALKAVEEYLESGTRPTWLKYTYVA